MGTILTGIIWELITEIITGTLRKLTMGIMGTLWEHTETVVTRAQAVAHPMLVGMRAITNQGKQT